MYSPHSNTPHVDEDDIQQSTSSLHNSTQYQHFLTVPAPHSRNSPTQPRSDPVSHHTAIPSVHYQLSQSHNPTPPRISVPVLPSQPIEQDLPGLLDYDLLATHSEQPLTAQQQALVLGTSSMSTYSSSSQDSVYSTPGAQYYRPVMNNSRTISRTEKDQLIRSLQTHRVNTLTELRRIEKVSASLDQAEVREPLTSAWAHYVNSNNLLSELRGLTRNYPFSSECLDEAKWKVIEDPASTRSWNYCWLVLVKIQNEQLILKHAHSQAALPKQWGGRKATSAGVTQLANAFVAEWTWALGQMLRHWESPPTTTGY